MQGTLQLGSGPLPSYVQVQLTWDGVVQSTQNSSTTGMSPGQTLTGGDYTAVVTSRVDNSTASDASLVAGSGRTFLIEDGHNYASPGSYTINVSLTDAGGASTTLSTTATVSAATQSLSTPAINAVEGQSFSGNVALFTPADPNVSYTATIGWGDGSSDSGALTSNGAGAFWISGADPYVDESPVGTPYVLTVTVSPVNGPASGALTAMGTATVTDATLTDTAGAALTAYPGVSTGSVLVGRFLDANASASPADFTVTVSWGDNTGTSTGEVTADPQGGLDVSAAHTFAAPTNYAVVATVNDDGGQSVSLSGTATVATATLSLTATEGQSFSGTVATFTGAASQASGATIDWGDGQTTSGNITDNGDGTFSISGAHTFADEGDYDLNVSVTVSGSGTLSAAGPVTVEDAVLTALSAASLSGSAGDPLSASGPVLLAHFADANPQAALTDYSSSVSWGDGDSEPATVEASPGGGVDVYGDHMFGNGGIYTFDVTLSDDGGQSATASGTATISLIEGQSESVSLLVTPASGTQLTAGTTYTASLDWGDGTSSPATGEVAANGTQILVSGAHVLSEEGDTTITATADDPAGSGGTASLTVPVSDAPLQAWGQDISTVAGQGFSGTVASFSDANLGAPLSDYSISIDWGDQQQSAGTAADNGGSLSVSGRTHLHDAGPLYGDNYYNG